MASGDASKQLDQEFRCVVVLVLMTLFGLFFLGCANDEQPTVAKEKTQIEQPATTKVASSEPAAESHGIAPAQLLVGTWLGGAYIDEAKVEQLLVQMDEPTRTQIEADLNRFRTTVMAIDFRRDGSMDNEIEIMDNGEVIRVPSFGQWQVVERQQDNLVVEMTETLPDGTMEKSQRTYKLYDDGDHFAITVPLGGALDQCNPLIVFERQDMGATAIAEQPAQTQTK